MRDAARRNETANCTLTAGIAGSARWRRKGQGNAVHATGLVPGSMGNTPSGPAHRDFGITRGQPGSAEDHVTPPGGFKPVLTFTGDKAGSEAGAQVQATKSGDMWSITVNNHAHYHIPEAVISGG